MVDSEVQQALEQVRDLKIKLMESQIFRGYSGTARIVSGFVALAAAVIMSKPSYPANISYHMAGWALVYTVAVFLNGGALFGRFLSTSRGLQDWNRLRPAWDIVPPLIVAGALTMNLFMIDATGSFFGLWMAMYGVIHLASRHSLPRLTEHVGWYYLLCGVYYLTFPVSFFNPWPMGIVFCLGELAGGMVFLTARRIGA